MYIKLANSHCEKVAGNRFEKRVSIRESWGWYVYSSLLNIGENRIGRGTVGWWGRISHYKSMK